MNRDRSMYLLDREMSRIVRVHLIDCALYAASEAADLLYLPLDPHWFGSLETGAGRRS